ncbi:MAG: tyrosine-type recombinase/integrase [Lachnospiraceae bacterium]
MIKEVKKAFLTLRQKNLQLGSSGDFTVDGYHDFIFLTLKRRRLYMPNTIGQMLTRIVKSYNDEETKAAAIENREPLLLPHLTPHIMRHTFCTRFCENETNVRVIQEIMGHKDIKITMNIYSHVTIDKARECMESMERALQQSLQQK